MITYSQFIARLPEFKVHDTDAVEQAITDVLIETNSYEGLGNPALQSLAFCLHVAHNLTIGLWAAEGKPGPLKAVRSNNDSMEFAVNNVGFGLESTTYGVRLCTLLRCANTVFTVC